MDSQLGIFLMDKRLFINTIEISLLVKQWIMHLILLFVIWKSNLVLWKRNGGGLRQGGFMIFNKVLSMRVDIIGCLPLIRR